MPEAPLATRRFITLYYASLSSRRALQAIASWLFGVVRSRRRRRAELGRVVAAKTGARAAFPVGSGRSALTLCLRAAGIGAGDEVLVSSYTCLAVPTGVVAAGATPVYADVDAGTLNLNADTVRRALTPRVRAIVVQHTLGKPAPVAEIRALAAARNILLIEDCALAVGSHHAGAVVGSLGDAAIFSMELSKTISAGWGGVLTINDAALAKQVGAAYAGVPEPGYWTATRDLWQTAISAWCHQPHIYDGLGKYVLFAGFTSRLFRRSTPPEEFAGGVRADFLRKMGGAQADLARLQWDDLESIAASCAANARRLRNVLRELGIEMPGEPAPDEVSVAPRVTFFDDDRPQIMGYFRDRGIELGEWFDGPLSPVPTASVFNYHPGRYPSAEAAAERVVNLPCHSRLSTADVESITDTLKAYYAGRLTFSN